MDKVVLTVRDNNPMLVWNTDLLQLIIPRDEGTVDVCMLANHEVESDGDKSLSLNPCMIPFVDYLTDEVGVSPVPLHY